MPIPIRVLVVDDSALMRKLVTDLLSSDPRIEVVGQARDGADGLAKVDQLNPDVVTMDVEMPNMDGVQALGEIMRSKPRPVIMVSSLTQDGAATTLKCLSLGAVDFVGKPSGSISLDIDKVASEIVNKVVTAAQAKVQSTRPASPLAVVAPPAPSTTPRKHGSEIRLITIGSSTGGPNALHHLVPKIPGTIGVPIVIVQHLPEMFTRLLAQRLDQESALTVKEAAEGDRLTPGTVLVAPGGKHLQFDRNGVASLSIEPPVHGVRPAVDVTMASLVGTYGPNMLSVLLTGMGRDGAAGMKAVRDSGGETIAEHESSCVVYGMPRAAYDLGGVDQLLPLDAIAPAMVEVIRHRSKAGVAELNRQAS